MDTTFIHNLNCQAIIGIHAFERLKPQRLIISVDLYRDITKAAVNEAIEFALNYFEITQFIEAFVGNSEYQLIETLAENLADTLIKTYQLEAIKLRLQKPGALTQTQQVGVEIYRQNQST